MRRSLPTYEPMRSTRDEMVTGPKEVGGIVELHEIRLLFRRIQSDVGDPRVLVDEPSWVRWIRVAEPPGQAERAEEHVEKIAVADDDQRLLIALLPRELPDLFHQLRHAGDELRPTLPALRAGPRVPAFLLSLPSPWPLSSKPRELLCDLARRHPHRSLLSGIAPSEFVASRMDHVRHDGSMVLC